MSLPQALYLFTYATLFENKKRQGSVQQQHRADRGGRQVIIWECVPIIQNALSKGRPRSEK